MSDTTSAAFPISMAVGPQGDIIQWPERGISQRLYVATEMMKVLLTISAWQVMTREEVVKEAYAWADALAEHQHDQ